MKNTNSAAAELAFLFKVMPAMQDVNTVDQIYRLLLAIATAGETIGYRRAMLFAADTRSGEIRGRYGIERPEAQRPRKATFEEMARSVFDLYEGVESHDLTLKARVFSVPLGWQRSALVKAVNTGHPVLAEEGLSEFATDPFFNFFGTTSYIAVPIRFQDRVTAVLAADKGVGTRRGSTEDISLLHSLAQHAAASAQRIIDISDSRRRFRVLSKIIETLNTAEVTDKLEGGLKLSLTMITRAMGATGCFLKDLTRQKTVHIKPVSDYTPDEDDDDVAIGECFEKILDRAAGRVETVWGDANHPLLDEKAGNVRLFFAHPLVCGSDVAGAMAVYTEEEDNPAGATGYRPEDKNLFILAAGIIAAKIEVSDKETRIQRIEDFVQELSSNLSRERERSRIGEKGVSYQSRVSEDLQSLRKILSTRTPYTKRFPMIVEVIKSMQDYSEEAMREMTKRDDQYRMTEFFPMVLKAVQSWQADNEDRSIDLTIRIPEAGPSLLVDRKKITKAIQNILTVTAETLGEADKMMVECSAEDDRVRVCIADTGKGIAGDAISRLFMPFEHVDDDDDGKRALSLAGEILQKHSGELTIRSSLSWKTILIMSFPDAGNRDRRKALNRRGKHERRTTQEVK